MTDTATVATSKVVSVLWVTPVPAVVAERTHHRLDDVSDEPYTWTLHYPSSTDELVEAASGFDHIVIAAGPDIDTTEVARRCDAHVWKARWRTICNRRGQREARFDGWTPVT